MLCKINKIVVTVFFVIIMATTSFSQSMQINSSGFQFDPNSVCILKFNNWGNPNGDPVLYPNWNNWCIIGYSSNWFYRSYISSMYYYNLYDQSDSTLKENISDLENVFDKIKKIRTVRFDYKPLEDENGKTRKNEDNKNKIGFLAQDILKYFPEMVKKDDESGKYAVNYMEMIPVLIKAVQDLKTIVDQQQQTIKELAGK